PHLSHAHPAATTYPHTPSLHDALPISTADLEMEDATVDGWAGPIDVRRIKGRKITLVPILRAGLGMLPGVLELIPAAKVSVVGIDRKSTRLNSSHVKISYAVFCLKKKI